MVQVVEMTHDEKVEMYKKFTKLKLIEMLIACNEQLERVLHNQHTAPGSVTFDIKTSTHK